MQDHFPSKFVPTHPRLAVRPTSAIIVRHELRSVSEKGRDTSNRRGSDVEEVHYSGVEAITEPFQFLGRLFVTLRRKLVELRAWVKINPSAPVRLDCYEDWVRTG